MLSFEDLAGQSAHMAQLRRDFAARQNVHAYLFSGPKGTGKRSAALLCAQTVLCGAQTGRPCGFCGPCRRVAAGTHPDVHIIEPENGKKQIGVGVMRKVIDEVATKSFEDGAKIMLIPEAERMNASAQNCLLKTLEEPPEGTVFFLTTDQPAALLPTIVSRCRPIRFHPLSTEDAAGRLTALGQSAESALRKARMAEGCVGQALAIDDAQLEMRYALTKTFFAVHRAGDVIAVTNSFKEKDKNKDDARAKQKQALDVLEDAVRDILRAQAGKEPLGGAGYAPEAEAFAKAVPLTGGLALMQCVTDARKMIASNVPFASALESVLLKISEEYTRWPW